MLTSLVFAFLLAGYGEKESHDVIALLLEPEPAHVFARAVRPTLADYKAVFGDEDGARSFAEDDPAWKDDAFDDMSLVVRSVTVKKSKDLTPSKKGVDLYVFELVVPSDGGTESLPVGCIAFVNGHWAVFIFYS